MTPEREMGDTMMMGLRLIDEGVSQRSFVDRFGTTLEAVYPAQISRLTKLGLLETVNGAKSLLRLTKRGRLLGNQVFSEFV
jgi:oxygen-independent coproporphyrinogen-3 oxidase